MSMDGKSMDGRSGFGGSAAGRIAGTVITRHAPVSSSTPAIL
jgi:hypothetical protein